jgi:hypothetical protein
VRGKQPQPVGGAAQAMAAPLGEGEIGNTECIMLNAKWHSAFCIVHFALCI